MASLRDAALLLIETLDRLGIHYAIGGSFASSFHGIARATQDLDLVVELPMNRCGTYTRLSRRTSTPTRRPCCMPFEGACHSI
jgi:hypothetical protein